MQFYRHLMLGNFISYQRSKAKNKAKFYGRAECTKCAENYQRDALTTAGVCPPPAAALPRSPGRCGDNALYPLTDVGALQVDFAVLCHNAFHLVAGFVPLVQCHRVLRSRLVALNNSTKREVCKIQNCFARHT